MSRKNLSSLADKDLQELGLSDETADALRAIRALVDEQYRERFIELAQALNRQAAALDRIQSTLSILVKQVAPQLEHPTPVAFRVAGPDEEPDLASAIVTADPIGAGFTLSQADVARAVGIKETDASILIRAFGLRKDSDLAVTVRQGKRELYNYHPLAVERLRALIENPAKKRFKSTEQQTLTRVRRGLGFE